MTIDWIATLQEQADFAKQIAEEVKQTLEIADLTTSQASRLYRVVEQGAQTFDRTIEEMEQFELDDELTEAAETIADIWTDLSVTAANKLRVMQRGFNPLNSQLAKTVPDPSVLTGRLRDRYHTLRYGGSG